MNKTVKKNDVLNLKCKKGTKVVNIVTTVKEVEFIGYGILIHTVTAENRKVNFVADSGNEVLRTTKGLKVLAFNSN